jgi:CheY-like chemotaxis protein
MARILVVEDERSSAEVAAVVCRAAGHTVDIAVNGCEAWERLKREPYDLVLLDLRMPQMDGLTLARLLRGDPAFLATAILVVTARLTQEDRTELARLGVGDVIMKPYSARMLQRAVSGLVNGVDSAPLRVELVRVWEHQVSRLAD